MVSESTTRKARIYNGIKMPSSMNDVGETGQLYVKE